MPLNIPLLTATRDSILDERNPFDMSLWCYCIAGHANACIGHTLVASNDFIVFFDGGRRIANELGLDPEFARWLFGQGFSRGRAAEVLTELILNAARENSGHSSHIYSGELTDNTPVGIEERDEELACV